mgnify:CR=1 FL=1
MKRFLDLPDHPSGNKGHAKGPEHVEREMDAKVDARPGHHSPQKQQTAPE